MIVNIAIPMKFDYNVATQPCRTTSGYHKAPQSSSIVRCGGSNCFTTLYLSNYLLVYSCFHDPKLHMSCLLISGSRYLLAFPSSRTTHHQNRSAMSLVALSHRLTLPHKFIRFDLMSFIRLFMCEYIRRK